MSKVINQKHNYSYYVDTETALSKVKDYCAKYDSKVHYVNLGQSLFTKIDRFLDRCTYPSENKIDYIPPDEIDIEIASRLFLEKNAIEDDFLKECVLLSMASILRKRVNRFYKDCNNHSFSLRLGRDFTFQEKEQKIRFDRNLKHIRGIK